MDNSITGFLLINKPKDITSFTVVATIKKLVGKKVRVGHAGTLDPFATGLLIIAIDHRATKHIDKIQELDKAYTALGKLGELTDSLDLTGTILKTESTPTLTHKDLEKALASFGSSYLQTAPLYSALKHQGTPLYKLARNKNIPQKELDAIIKTKQRMVDLYQLELLDYSPPSFTIKARVSRGTYVRTLINDIAKRAGTVATTYELERIKIGPFSLDKAIALEELKSLDAIKNHLIERDTMLKKLEEVSTHSKLYIKKYLCTS